MSSPTNTCADCRFMVLPVCAERASSVRAGVNPSSLSRRYNEIDTATRCNEPGAGDQTNPTRLIGTMLEARKYRAYPTPEQAARAARWLGAQRFLWNLALEHRQTAYRGFGASVSKVDQCKELTDLRANVEWIKDVPAQSQQQLLADLDQAFRNWWGGSHKAPTWRKRGQGQGIRFPGQACSDPAKLNRRWSQVHLPKLGAVRYRRCRPIGGELRNVTLKQDTVGDWWIVILVETGVEPTEPRASGPVVGVDRGVAISAQASDGRSWQCPTPGRGEAQRRLRLERKLARQVKGSARRERTKQQLAKVRRRDARRRTDWAHNVSAELVADAMVVGFEDLNVKGMTRSASGTIDKPGTNVAQKRGLNRAILAQGWGDLQTFTEYKGIKVGCHVVTVPAAYTSQRCAQCGRIGERKNQASFTCPHCGESTNADLNAARNIEQAAAGQAVTARGDLGVSRSVKREPTRLVAA